MLSSTIRVKLMLAVFIVVVALDQVSKQVILGMLTPGETIPVIPYIFNLTLAFNRGAAFGLFSDLPGIWRPIVLVCTGCIALAAVFYFLIRDYKSDAPAQFGLALILGGAAGNFVDRIRLGEVVDFLDFYIKSSHWPAFNVADSAICIGVLMVFLRRPKNAETPSS